MVVAACALQAIFTTVPLRAAKGVADGVRKLAWRMRSPGTAGNGAGARACSWDAAAARCTRGERGGGRCPYVLAVVLIARACVHACRPIEAPLDTNLLTALLPRAPTPGPLLRGDQLYDILFTAIFAFAALVVSSLNAGVIYFWMKVRVSVWGTLIPKLVPGMVMYTKTNATKSTARHA